MKIIRKLIRNKIYFISLDDDNNPIGISESLKMLINTGGITASKLLEKAKTEKGELLIPVSPEKIICIGLNYHLHAKESGKSIPELPMFFLKPTTALIPNGGEIILPTMSKEVHYEGELAVIIGKTAKNVKAEDANAYILGYTLMNDVTARDLQRVDRLYTRAKGFDTFAPLGPAIVNNLDPDSLTIETKLNGKTVQKSSCSDMIFKIPMLIEYLSSIMTLKPFDIISTGTPSGVGQIVNGDTVEITIKEIGTLRNWAKIETEC